MDDHRKGYVIKTFFISSLLLIFFDNSIRSGLEYIKYQPIQEIMGWLSLLGKGWVQAIPCLLLLGAGIIKKQDGKMKETGIRTLYGLILSGFFAQGIKHLIGRPRPAIMDESGIMLGPTFASGFDSFPSGHATSAFAFASILSSFYPSMRFFLYAYAILVSFSRVYIEAHFFSDVIAGIALGLWTGWIFIWKRWEDVKELFRHRGIILAILCVAFFLFFLNIGGPGLFDVDEAVFAESAREMVETGDWITPHYNNVNRYDKPVLFYWLISSAYHIFGVSEFAARFWSALLGTGLVMVIYFFVRPFCGKRQAILSALILSTSLEVIILSHAAITDMTLTFFIAICLVCFYIGYRDDRHRKWWYWGGYISSGLAVLTKGPVGIVVPGLIIFFFLLYMKDLKQGLKEMKLLSGMVIFFCVAAPWYIVETWINGWEYIDAFFIKHNITRYTGVISGHSGPVYYFIPVIFLTFFPWSIFIPQSIRRSFISKNPILPFAAIWFLVIFIFFSISRTKLPGYIAPLSPAVAILTGMLWNDYIGNSKRGNSLKWSFTGYVILGLLFAGITFVLPFYLKQTDLVSKYLHGDVEGIKSFYLIGAIIGSGICVSIIAFIKRQGKIVFISMVGMMAATASVILLLIVPVADRHLQSTLREYAKRVSIELDRRGGKFVIYDLNKPSLLFYSRRAAIIIEGGEEERLRKILSGKDDLYIITKESQVDSINKYSPVKIISQDKDYALLEKRGILSEKRL